MHGAQEFLTALTIVLGVAAVTTVVFQRLGQPVVLGYILAGFIIGPNFPVPLVADREIIQTLSELGVILLMFSLGLEFALGKLFKLGPQAGLTALLETSLMLWLGFITGKAFGWTTVECLFAGAIVAISSTTIIAKTFDEQKVKNPLRDQVVGVLIVEDLIAIVLMATLTAVASGSGLSAWDMAATTGKLAAFLFVLIVVGLLLVPRTVRAITRLGRPETTLVASIGFCFGISLLAYKAGYSVALGAFIAGSLVAESGEGKTIEHLLMPVRDMFAAIFFVSVGVLIDPAVIAEHWVALVAFTVVLMVGKVVGVSLGGFLTGSTIRSSVQAGMSQAQIGEFSFIIAGLGLSLNATGGFLYPLAIAVSAITTLTTPWMVKASGPVASFVDRKLPRPLQTFVTLYGTWVERLTSAPPPTRISRGRDPRRLIKVLLLDLGLIVAVAVGASVAMPRLVRLISSWLGLDPQVARVGIIVTAVGIILPLCAGVAGVVQRLGLAMAEVALPSAGEGKLDLAAAPRKALIRTLQLAILLVAGLPVLVVTQPFLGGVHGPLIFVLLLVAMGWALWQGTTNLDGHVRAGAETIVEALMNQARKGAVPAAPGAHAPHGAAASSQPDALTQVRQFLPGLGEPTPVALESDSPAVGRTLAELNLRGLTGSTVLAISRGEEGVVVPTAREVLRAGDVLALAGTHAAIEAAREVLSPVPVPAQEATAEGLSPALQH